MPRYAVFSDVHSNLAALDAFVKHSQKREVQRYLCCGDIVGYGASPGECLRRVFELCLQPCSHPIAIVRGNHDHAVALDDVSKLNEYAAEAARWTRRQLSPSEIALLESLPFVWEDPGGEFLLVHGSPYQPERWHYLFDVPDSRRAFHGFENPVCFTGHSHVPETFRIDAEFRIKTNLASHIGIRPDYRYLVNVGSVGQPRDNNPQGCYVIYDTDRGIFQRERFWYDVQQAQQSILKAGLPSILAARLSIGF